MQHPTSVRIVLGPDGRTDKKESDLGNLPEFSIMVLEMGADVVHTLGRTYRRNPNMGRPWEDFVYELSD